MNKKIILITGFLIIAALLFIVLQPSSPLPGPNEPASTNQTHADNKTIQAEKPVEWSPNIILDAYTWDQTPNPYLENATEAISFADNLLSESLGSDFFRNHLQLHPMRSTISYGGTIFYLKYTLLFPKNGLDYNTTTHATVLSLNLEKNATGFHVLKNGLENINERVNQGDFINRSQALQIAKGEIEKSIPLPKEIILDFQPPNWLIRYDIPQEKTPDCTYKRGSEVYLYINAITREVKKEVNCNSPPADSPPIVPTEPAALLDDSGSTQEGVDQLVSANNQFSIDFYKEVSEDDKNLFFSPWSLESALSMTYEGARDQTADEMASVLKIPTDLAVRGPAFASLFNQINSQDKNYQLSTANALWAEQTYEFLPEFFDTVNDYYGGKVTNMDFKGDAEGSRQTINTWVEEQTNDKIKDLIPKGVINELTRLVLTNAVYFKGDWATQFDIENTEEADFEKSKTEKIKVDLMSMHGEEFNYFENDDLQLLELPYINSELSMVVLLPKGDISSLEDSLTSENLDSWMSDAWEREVDVYLPKFKFETKYMLKLILSDMGMPTAFSMQADLSGMDATQDLYIEQVIHQAYIDVNEEGTEAAAATAVVVQLKAMPEMPPEFHADHPFIFLIKENKNDMILFMGKVVDPTTD